MYAFFQWYHVCIFISSSCLFIILFIPIIISYDNPDFIHIHCGFEVWTWIRVFENDALPPKHQQNDTVWMVFLYQRESPTPPVNGRRSNLVSESLEQEKAVLNQPSLFSSLKSLVFFWEDPNGFSAEQWWVSMGAGVLPFLPGLTGYSSLRSLLPFNSPFSR